MYFLYCFYVNKNFRRVLVIISPVFILPIVISVYSMITSDHSFVTKLEIFNNLYSYMQNSDLINLIFGNALNDPKEIYNKFIGYYGHTHYFDLIFKGGLLITILYTFMICSPAIKSRLISLFFIVPFILLGLSNIRIFAHYIFYLMPFYFIFFKKV